MESTRPIRALTRGLDALSVLNLRDGATVSEVAQEIRLPRTTVYRILETLSEAGCAFRDPADERYRLTAKVRSLSSGFSDEDWIRETAAPCIRALGARVVWPVTMSTLVGTTMLVRDSTDHSSPLASERYSAGYRLGLIDSASGRAYLANCSTERRAALFAALAVRNPTEMERLLHEIRAQGFALVTRTRHAQEDLVIGVPVLHDSTVLAVLEIRIAAAAMSADLAIARFLPDMRLCAHDISARWATNH